MATSRRVHVRGEDPQPNVEEQISQQSEIRKPVIIKKIKTRLPLHELHINGQNQTNNNDSREPIPSPTMPPLEDAEARSECKEINTTETLLSVEIRAKISRNFPQLDQHTVAPPRVVDSSTNTPIWGNTDKINSQPQTTDIQHYKYIQSTTTESSQYLDPDASDDDGHRECGLGEYKNCPDNPANRPTMQHQEGNFDESYPDPSDRGIT